MEGHEVAAMPQDQPETSGTRAGAGWGTCEELLLVSAVKRHGVNNWNSISEELKARAISLHVSPLYFSEAACKQKYDALRGRYASSSSSTRSRNEDLGNDMHWFEEVRKLRVAHLKRELEHYDGSIGSLQVKIKRLKAEKAQEPSVSKQLRKSIANSQSNDVEGHGGSSCEVSLHRSAEESIEVECDKLHNTPVVLELKRNSQERTSSQAPSNLQPQVLSEGEQWHDAIEKLPDAFPACTDVKASVRVTKNSPPLNSVEGGNDVEGGNSAVLCEVSAAPRSPAVDLQETEADVDGTLNRDDVHADPVITRSSLGAGHVVVRGLDHDEVTVGALNMQTGQQLPVKMERVDDELDIFHVDSEQKGMDKMLEASADIMINAEVGKNGDSECGETESHSKEDVMVLPILPSSQQLVSSGDDGNDAGGRHGEPDTVTETELKVSKNEEDIGKLDVKETMPVEGDNLEGGPLDLAKAEPGVQLERTVIDCPVEVAELSADAVLNSTILSPHKSDGCHDSNKDLTLATVDEVISRQQKTLHPGECNVEEDDSAVPAVKEIAALAGESGEIDQLSESTVMERVSMLKESKKGGVSAMVPVSSFTKSESSVLEDGAIIITEKSDPKGAATRSSGLLYISDGSKGSLSPERHIVIALDDPGKPAPCSKSVSIMPDNAEDNDVYQIDTPSRADVVCTTEATGLEEEHHISVRKDREMAIETPSKATDSRMEDDGTGQENETESASQAVEAVQSFDVASITVMSPKSRSEFKAVCVDHDVKMAEETATDNDKQPCTSERSSRRVVVQSSREDSAARDGIEVADNIVSVPDTDTLVISPEQIQVEPGERQDANDNSFLQASLCQSLELARSASCVGEIEGRQSPVPTLTADPDTVVVAKTDPELTDDIRQDARDVQDALHGGESNLPEIIIDMKLEYSKEELSGVDSEAELSSPLESLAGGLDSKMPSSHEGSDSVQDQEKDAPSDQNRERTQGYVDSDVDKSEAGSPLDGPYEMSPSSRRNRKEPRVHGKLLPLLEVLRSLSNHKSAIFFKGRQEDPRYSSLIRRHVDLQTVRQRLDEGAYSGSNEFFRDLLLIFNNAMVYYPHGSTEFRGAKALFTEASKEMNRIFQTEALLKQDRPATRTREVKKPKAFVGVATSGKVVAPSIGGVSSAKLPGTTPPLTTLPDSGNRKRVSSRLGLVETPTNSQSEGGAARSASMNVLGGPSSSQAEEAENSQVNSQDQEVNGRLKDKKKLQKGSGSSRGRPPREEFLEGILLKNAANKTLGRPKLRDVKEEEGSAKKPAAVPTKGAGGGKNKAESEFTRKKEAEKEKMRGKEVQGKERDEIDDDDDFLRNGKSLSKLRDLDVTMERRADGKAAPKSRASTAARVALNSHDTVAQTVGRPSRGGRKSTIPSKEPARPSELQAKKRLRK